MSDVVPAKRPRRITGRPVSWWLVFLALWLGVRLGAEGDAPPCVWEVGGEWQNDAGETVRLGSLRGEFHVVAMFYTGCHIVCPTTVDSLRWIEKNLPEKVARVCRPVLVTLDPGGDSVAELQAYRAEQQLPGRWIILRGQRKPTAQLAERLGVSFRQTAYRTTHPAALIVIDREGRVVSRYLLLHPDLREVVRELAELASRNDRTAAASARLD